MEWTHNDRGVGVCVLPSHEGHTADQQTNRKTEGPCKPKRNTASSTYTDANHHCNTHNTFRHFAVDLHWLYIHMLKTLERFVWI